MQCVEMLHRSLCTTAPRVAFYQQQRPGEGLPHCREFAKADKVFSQRCKLDPLEFAVFKASWLASHEGRAACQYEAIR